MNRNSCGLVTKLCPTLATPLTVAHQAPLSMGFSRQEYWSGLPFPSPGDLHNQESNLGLLDYKQILYQLSYFRVGDNYQNNHKRRGDWTQWSGLAWGQQYFLKDL